MRKFVGLLTTLMAVFHLGRAIVGTGRDVVLTPKQGLQLNGKRLYYKEEDEVEKIRDDKQLNKRPWERTLKHVTYVTLFTDAAIEAASGNLSQLHQYHEFLQTPYMLTKGRDMATGSRFGDIVTLASGRLEQVLNSKNNANSSYRFVEGSSLCTPVEHLQCETTERRALWQVQRIRHRDGHHDPSGGRYHYEIKFSVTPLTSTGWSQQNYIQKEDDYPLSFGRLVYNDKREQIVAQRRQDRDRDRDRDREQSQATFAHGIFQPPPPLLPPAPPVPLLPPKLNIGEYLLKGQIPQKGGSKIELFPGLFNLGLRQNYITPTTFRPNYSAVKFSNSHSELERFPLTNGNDLIGDGIVGTSPRQIPGAPVTHHFHHHFYTAPGSSSLHEGQLELEQQYRISSTTTPPTPSIESNFYSQLHGDHQIIQFPSSESSGESLESGDNLHTPQIYGQASKYSQDVDKLPPLLIYAGGASSSSSSAGSLSSGGGADDTKSFVQSEPLEESVYRYSEPDPLYVHQNPVDVLQLNTPENYAHSVYQQNEEESPVDSVEEQRPASSQKKPELATTAMPTIGTTRTLTNSSSTSSSSSSTTTSTTTTTTTTVATPTTSSSSFVSTSTNFSPLRSLSRYRTTPRITAGKSTTTTTTSTESPLAKWSKRRKELDSKAKHSYRHESKVAFMPIIKTFTPNTTTTTPPTTTPGATTTTTTTTTESLTSSPPTQSQSDISRPREVVEVLTQKSVSKSVSIKVGENGEEIPIIVDDNDDDDDNGKETEEVNEVKKPIPNN